MNICVLELKPKHTHIHTHTYTHTHLLPGNNAEFYFGLLVRELVSAFFFFLLWAKGPKNTSLQQRPHFGTTPHTHPKHFKTRARHPGMGKRKRVKNVPPFTHTHTQENKRQYLSNFIFINTHTQHFSNSTWIYTLPHNTSPTGMDFFFRKKS